MTIALSVVLLIVVATAACAPRVGLVAGWRRRTAAQAREAVENALKHLLGQATAGQAATFGSMQGALRAGDKALLALMARLEREHLVRTEGDRFRLTPEGERLALHIVRAHRLWELYLADELGVPVGQVHAQAERAEHHLSPADADRLSAAMGHPEIDPHGNPIPNRDGEVQPLSATPLSAWPIDRPARIVHIEDEPGLAFAQIAALGLHPGQIVRVMESSPTRIVVHDGEQEYVLAPMLAGNVHVGATVLGVTPVDEVVRLSELASGRLGEIVALDPACRGFMRRRLLDLGFTPGAHVRPDLTTFAGDPRAYRVRGTTIALRNEQSARVLVRAVA